MFQVQMNVPMVFSIMFQLYLQRYLQQVFSYVFSHIFLHMYVLANVSLYTRMLKCWECGSKFGEECGVRRKRNMRGKWEQLEGGSREEGREGIRRRSVGARWGAKCGNNMGKEESGRKVMGGMR